MVRRGGPTEGPWRGCAGMFCAGIARHCGVSLQTRQLPASAEARRAHFGIAGTHPAAGRTADTAGLGGMHPRLPATVRPCATDRQAKCALEPRAVTFRGQVGVAGGTSGGTSGGRPWGIVTGKKARTRVPTFACYAHVPLVRAPALFLFIPAAALRQLQVTRGSQWVLHLQIRGGD